MKFIKHKHILFLGFLFFTMPWFIKSVVTGQPDSELGVYKLITSPYDIEFFGASKARFLMLVILLLTGQFLWMFFKHKLELKFSPALILMLSFFLWITIGAFSSPYRHTAMMGLSTRYQGLYVYGYYMLLIFFIYLFVKSKEDVFFLMKCMLFSVVPVFIVALLQSFDISFILSDFLRPYHKLGEDPYFYSRIDYYINYHLSNSKIGFNEVSSTLYNANYVGVYASTMIFIALGFIVKADSKYQKLTYSFLLFLSIVLLALSTSKTGAIISTSLCILYLTIITFKKQIRTLKWTLGTIVATSVILLVLNASYGNRLLGDLFIIKEDSLSLSTPLSTSPDQPPTDNRYINNITFFEGETIITDNTSTLILIIKDDAITLKDADILQRQPQWHFEDKTDYILVKHHSDELLFQKTDDNYIGIYGPRGLTTNITQPMSLPINGHLFTYRGFNWSVTLKAISQSPIIGHGPDTIVYYYPYDDLINLINYTGKATSLLLNPHNMYLDFVFAGGIFALISFIIFIAYLYIKSFIYLYRNKTDDLLIILFPLSAILLMGLMNDTIISTGVIMYGLIGLLSVYLLKILKPMHDELNTKTN